MTKICRMTRDFETSLIVPDLTKFSFCIVQGHTMVILHEVKLVPEAIAKGTNGRIVISSLATLVYKHIPIAQSIAEHCNFL